SSLAFGRDKPFLQFFFGLRPSPVDSLEKFGWPFASSIRRLITQHNGMAARDFDCAAPFEVPQHARDCLNGEAKIIRDVPTRHWQIDEIILSWRCALDHFYEETDDPLFCSRGQEQEKMILLTSKLAGCQRQQSICNFKIGRG